MRQCAYVGVGIKPCREVSSAIDVWCNDCKRALLNHPDAKFETNASGSTVTVNGVRYTAHVHGAGRCVAREEPCSDVPHFVLMGTASSGAATAMEAEALIAPKPPTLREWLGDRASELGPWAEVLRDQPVPRGWIQRWESYRTGDTWELVAHGRGRSETITPTDVIYAIGTWPADPYGSTSEALQMSLFTRHPAVNPEPRKPTLRTWFGNEEEP